MVVVVLPSFPSLDRQYRRSQRRLGRRGNSISVQTSEIKKKAVDALAVERIEENRKAGRAPLSACEHVHAFRARLCVYERVGQKAEGIREKERGARTCERKDAPGFSAVIERGPRCSLCGCGSKERV